MKLSSQEITMRLNRMLTAALLALTLLLLAVLVLPTVRARREEVFQE